MATGQYGSTANASQILGMLVQAAAQVKIGTQELWGSLETTSDVYAAYTASIGVNSNSFDLGQFTELGTTINATVEPLEVANFRQPTVYYVTEEEFTINATLTQFDYRILEVLMHNGVMRKLDLAPNNEYLYTFGGACAIKRRPIQISVTNIGCFLPATQDAQLGVTGIILTGWNMQSQTGLVWDNIVANEVDTISSEWMGIPVPELPNGGNQGSIYLF